MGAGTGPGTGPRGVERERVARTVASMCSGGSSAIASAISPAILERKISPASCTCPIAKGSDEKAVKAVWCTADEKSTSLTS